VLDSFLKQSIAVLAAAILGALIVSLVLIHGLVIRPQIERSAADTAQMIRSLQLSFAQMDPFQQIQFAEALRVEEVPDFLVAEDAPENSNMQRSWFSRYFLNVLSNQHGIPVSEVVIDIRGRVWVSMTTAGQPYWLSLRALPASDPVAGLVVAAGIALFAALAGGIALQRRIALPLKRLEKAVGRMSSPMDIYDGNIVRPLEIAAVSRALTGMSERLQAADADRALLLAGVSHDLRTPLTKLRLSLAMLRDGDLELVEGAERNVIRIENMLSQFLDFARGFEAEETRAISLRSLLNQSIESCSEPSVVVLDAPANTIVQVKEAALLRALDNLLTNALRHGKPPIKLSGSAGGGEVLIEVRDAGQGISTEEARDLMRPFVRGNPSRTGEGTGLGFAIVEQVARAHCGEIEFEQGKERFTVRLRFPQSPKS